MECGVELFAVAHATCKVFIGKLLEYAGVSVGHAYVNSNAKSTYINLLRTYPQGVIAYNPGNGNQYHAVLLTDYDSSTDTFYCADPGKYAPSGRIPLASSSLVGSGQNGKINNCTAYWYVKSPSISLGSSSSSNESTVIYPTNGSIVKLASGVGNNMYMDFVCGNNNVQIYENADNSGNADWVKSQYFKLIHVSDGWYAIVNTGNGLAVDVTDINPASGTNVQQWQQTNSIAQLFKFYDAGGGYCYIKSKLGCYIDVCDGANRNNTNVWMYTFNGSNAQKWQIQYHSHTAASSNVTAQPTCTKTGVRTCSCYYCGVTYTETIAKKSHNSNTIIPAVAATCTATGLTQGKKCSMCGTVTVAQQTVPAKGHSDANSDGYCDSCGTDINPQSHCSCSCHKTGLPKLLFTIINFFQKLFGNNKVCDCGAKH